MLPYSINTHPYVYEGTSQPMQANDLPEGGNIESHGQRTASDASSLSQVTPARGRGQQYRLHRELSTRSVYDRFTLDRFPVHAGLLPTANNQNHQSKAQRNHLKQEREQFGRRLAILLQGGRVSPIEGMVKWAEVVYEHVRQNPSLPSSGIPNEATEIYRAAVIKIPDEQKCSIERYLNTLQTIDETNQGIDQVSGDEIGSKIRVYSQGQNKIPRQPRASPSDLYQTNRNLALGESFFLVPDPERSIEDNEEGISRLVLNPHPKHMPLLASAMASVISKTDEILHGKVGAYKWLGNRSDDAILYFCFPDVNCARSVAETLKEEIKNANNGEMPNDMFLPVQPPGSEFVDNGIYYAETASGHQDSVAIDRGKIVAKAVLQSRNGTNSLSENVRQACRESGYDPDNPARILNAEPSF